MASLNLITSPAAEPVSLNEVKAHLRINITDDDAIVTAHAIAGRERVEFETGRQLVTAIWELWLGAFPGMRFGMDSVLAGGWNMSSSLGANAWLDWSVANNHRFIDMPCAPLQAAQITVTGATHGTITVDGIASTTGLQVGMVVTSLAGTDFAPGTTIATIAPTSVTLNQAALSTLASVACVASTVGITYVDTNGVLQTWDPSQFQVHAPSGPVAPRGKIQPVYGVSWPVTRDQLDAVKVRFFAGYGAATVDSQGNTTWAGPQRLRRAILMIAGDLYENREATVVTDRRVTIEELPNGVDNILQQYRARPVLRAA